MKKYIVFPFAPGIRWKLHNGYIIPEVSISSFDHKLQNQDVSVIAYGGLLESFYSLSILEMINYNVPSCKLKWIGNSNYFDLLNMNGLAKPNNDPIDKKLLVQYPVPLFFDKSGKSYFNCLNNYLYIKPWYKKKYYKYTKAVLKQIIDNGLFSWDKRFFPKLRNLNLKPNKNKYVLLIPDKTNCSIHDFNCLDWSPDDIRFFQRLLNNKGLQLIILSNFPGRLTGIPNVFQFNLNLFFNYCPNAKYILSKDIDFLMVSLALSDSIKLISLPMPEAFKLKKNAKFINKKNDIYIDENLSPFYIVEKYI